MIAAGRDEARQGATKPARGATKPAGHDETRREGRLVGCASNYLDDGASGVRDTDQQPSTALAGLPVGIFAL